MQIILRIFNDGDHDGGDIYYEGEKLNPDAYNLIRDFQILVDPTTGYVYHMDMDRPFEPIETFTTVSAMSTSNDKANNLGGYHSDIGGVIESRVVNAAQLERSKLRYDDVKACRRLLEDIVERLSNKPLLLQRDGQQRRM